MINSLKEGSYMNRKGEWGQNLPPELTIEDGDDQNQKQPCRKRGRKEQPPKPPLKDPGEKIEQKSRRSQISKRRKTIEAGETSRNSRSPDTLEQGTRAGATKKETEPSNTSAGQVQFFNGESQGVENVRQETHQKKGTGANKGSFPVQENLKIDQGSCFSLGIERQEEVDQKEKVSPNLRSDQRLDIQVDKRETEASRGHSADLESMFNVQTLYSEEEKH